MKIIKTDGIFNFEEIVGSGGWYWCCDYASGDLFLTAETSSFRLLTFPNP